MLFAIHKFYCPVVQDDIEYKLDFLVVQVYFATLDCHVAFTEYMLSCLQVDFATRDCQVAFMEHMEETGQIHQDDITDGRYRLAQTTQSTTSTTTNSFPEERFEQ